MAKRVKKTTPWLRIFNVITGVWAIILSLIVMLYPVSAINTMIVLLAITFILIGVARLLYGLLSDQLPDRLALFNMIIGVALIIMAILSLLYTQVTTLVLIYFLAIDLVLNGIAKMMFGTMIDKIPKWLKGLLIITGLMSFIISFVIFFTPGLGLMLMIFLLAFTLLFNGITRVARAIAGL